MTDPRNAPEENDIEDNDVVKAAKQGSSPDQPSIEEDNADDEGEEEDDDSEEDEEDDEEETPAQM